MEFKLGLFLIVCLCIFVCESETQKSESPYTTLKMISAAGYPAEKHRVRTEDGYSLQMHRIPTGRRTTRRSDSAKGKRAVLLMHGLMGFSGNFVVMGPERSLAFLLADAGYDVWIGNFRGNIYTAHQNLTKKDPEFWEFSFHEHGLYDLPAMIDGILNVTGLQKIMYVGHSMGTTSFFTMMALRPEYNDKIIASVALAPAVYMDSVKPMVDMFIKSIDLPSTLRSRGMYSLSFRQDLLEMIIGSLCNPRDPQQDICLRFLYAYVGEDYEQHDPIMYNAIVRGVQPASWRQIEHYAKIAMTGVFTSWEDGLWGQVKPYNLTNVRVPVSLLYGINDQLSKKSQVMRLAKVLNSTGMLEDVGPASTWPKFNHLDFLFAKDVGKLLNKPLVIHLNKLYSAYGES